MREPSLIQSTYPAKRSRTDESKSETSQLSTLQTSVLSSACHNMPPLPGRGEDVQVIGDGDQPSEILSFTPSPRHSRQESPSPAQSSPYALFTEINVIYSRLDCDFQDRLFLSHYDSFLELRFMGQPEGAEARLDPEVFLWSNSLRSSIEGEASRYRHKLEKTR